MAQNQHADQLNLNNLVVRIDEDSASDLQALFDTVLKPDVNRPLQIPLRLRKLPNSFFNPPATGSKSTSVTHSRENSADSAFDTTIINSSGGNNQVCHSRAHSSPATLEQTCNLNQQQQPPPAIGNHHVKQRSCDAVSPLKDSIPLPPGWEQARTEQGQIYYLNHLTCTTTWEDPRKSLAVQMIQQQQVGALDKTPSESLGPLPYGWQQATTPEGEIYFINHQTRTTSWFDPRIPMHLQRTSNGGQQPVVSSTQDQANLQKARLQMLQMERDRLKQRQEEIRRQQGFIIPEMVDHSRQESADSGLGMGPTSTTPYPHDFLTNIDNVINQMDCTTNDTTLGVGDFSSTLLLDDVQSIINTATSSEDIIKPQGGGRTWL